MYDLKLWAPAGLSLLELGQGGPGHAPPLRQGSQSLGAASPAPQQPDVCRLETLVPTIGFAAIFLTLMSLLLTLHPQFLLTISPVFPMTTPLFPLDSWAFPPPLAVTILSSW